MDAIDRFKRNFYISKDDIDDDNGNSTYILIV